MIMATIGSGSIGVIVLGIYFIFAGARSGFSSAVGVGVSLVLLGGALGGIGLFMRERLEMTCVIFEEASLGLAANPELHAVTALSVASAAVVVLFLTLVAASIQRVPGLSQGWASLMFWHIVFSGYWIVGVLLAAYKVSVCGAIGMWWYAQRGAAPEGGDGVEYRDRLGALDSFEGPEQDGERVDLPPAYALYRAAWTSSLGSLAVGSLLISVLATASWMLRWTKATADAAVGGPRAPSSRLGRLALDTLTRLVDSVKELAELVNRFAYVYIAMHGISFFAACRRVLRLVTHSGLDLTVVEIVARFVLFMGKALGASLVTLATFAVLYSRSPTPPSGVLVGLAAVLSYTILHIFATTMDFAVITIFVAKAEEADIEQGILPSGVVISMTPRGGGEGKDGKSSSKSNGKPLLPTSARPSSAFGLDDGSQEQEAEEEEGGGYVLQVTDAEGR